MTTTVLWEHKAAIDGCIPLNIFSLLKLLKLMRFGGSGRAATKYGVRFFPELENIPGETRKEFLTTP